MKSKALAISILAIVVSVVAAHRAAAQHDEHHAQDQSTPRMMGGGMMGGMMETMTKMKGNQQQMFRLMEKMMASIKAIQDEKDPAALRSKLAEHQTLLNQMHDQMTQQGAMIGDMSDMMTENSSVPCGDAMGQTVAGTVQSISGDSVTVQTMGKDGRVVAVALTPSTKFTKDGSDVSAKELKVGDRVAINVKQNGDKLEATQVLFGQMLQQHMDMHQH